MIAIGVPAEGEDEPRIGISPETVKKLVKAGGGVAVPSGAGLRSHFADDDYAAAGARSPRRDADAVADADIVLTVRRPEPADRQSHEEGRRRHRHARSVLRCREASMRWPRPASRLFTMEFMPRITRAQSWTCSRRQANLAGYKAVVDAAAMFEQAMPMMMTAAGTVPAARVFIMGVGVAGLQAIATARRLGALVSATDVRPATKEQVGLARRQVHRRRGRGIQAGPDGGRLRQADVGRIPEEAGRARRQHIKNQDIVITTALIPGRPAPKLISRAMIESMKPGAVIVDLAAERGGNTELTEPGKTANAQRRAHLWPAQSGGRGSGQRLEPLCQEPPRLPRDHDRQEDKTLESTGTTSSSKARWSPRTGRSSTR